jgi:hypothetical protein
MQINIEKAREIRSRFLLNPVTISIFVVIFLLYAWLDVGQVLPSSSNAERVLAAVSGWCLYYFGFYILLPYLLSSKLTGPLPVFWQAFILVSALLLIETTATFIFVSKEISFFLLTNYLVSSMFTGVIGILAFCTIFRSNLERVFGEDPITSIFRSVKANEIDPLQALLPEKVRGSIFQLEAQTPYLLVTTSNGSALVRMSIKKAMECLDENSGWLVHRSRWVHKSRLVELRRRGRNRFFVDPDGNEFPISREMEKTLRTYLEFSE